jgi:hypothetical protein
MVRQIIGCRRNEIIIEWRNLHNVCPSPGMGRVIKSRIRGVGHVACIGK